MPDLGRDGDSEEALMPAIRRVIQYSGLDYRQVLELPTDVYLCMLRGAVIDELQATEEGRGYLATCERLHQTEPDMPAVRRMRQRLLGEE